MISVFLRKSSSFGFLSGIFGASILILTLVTGSVRANHVEGECGHGGHGGNEICPGNNDCDSAGEPCNTGNSKDIYEAGANIDPGEITGPAYVCVGSTVNFQVNGHSDTDTRTTMVQVGVYGADENCPCLETPDWDATGTADISGGTEVGGWAAGDGEITSSGRYTAPMNPGEVWISATVTDTVPYGSTGVDAPDEGSKWDEAASTSKTITIVGIANAWADRGIVESGAIPTYIVCKDSGDVFVNATSSPELPAGDLPSCWTTSGGQEISKLQVKVDTAQVGTKTITFTAGEQEKSVIVKVVEMSVDSSQMDGEDENEALYVPYNHNDSNDNGQNDLTETGFSDGDLVSLNIQGLSGVNAGVVQFIHTPGLSLWRQSNKSEALPGTIDLSVEAMPQNIYVEGLGVSSENADKYIQIQYADCTFSVPVTVYHLDIVLKGKANKVDSPADNEEEPGVFMPLNRDDDNSDHTPDYMTDGPVQNEDDLERLHVNVMPANLPIGTLSLTANGVKIFDDMAKGNLHSGNITPSFEDIEKYVEASSASDSMRDKSIEAELSVAGKDIKNKIKLTVVSVDLLSGDLAENIEPSPNEMDPGRLIAANTNDDDTNLVTDRDQSEEVSGESDLHELKYVILPSDLDQGDISFEVSQQLKLWKKSDKSEIAVLSWSLSPQQDAEATTGSVFVEGMAASLALATDQVALNTTTVAGGDAVNMTVVEADLDMDLDENGYWNDEPNHEVIEADRGGIIRFQQRAKLTLWAGPILSDGEVVLNVWGETDKVEFYATVDATEPLDINSELSWLIDTYPEEIWVEGLELSDSVGDIQFAFEYSFEVEGNDLSSVIDEVKATVVGVDIDVDSDNNDEFDPPQRTPQEDLVENTPDKAGKGIVENSADSDEDGVLDWVDFDGTQQPFAPLVIQWQGLETENINQAQVTISYSASDPSYLVDYGYGLEPPHNGQGQRGSMRLWKKNGEESRNPASLTAGGDYVAPQVYTWQELGGTAGNDLTLYIEGIGESSATISVSVVEVVDPQEETMRLVGSDVVKVMVMGRPLSRPDAYTTAHDTTTLFTSGMSLLSNDIIKFATEYVTGSQLVRGVRLTNGLKVNSTTEGGNVKVDSTGGFIYQPKPKWKGTDTFEYVATYGTEDLYFIPGDPVEVTVEVTNVAPVANDDAYAVHQGRILVVNAEAGVIANDTDPEDKPYLKATVVSDHQPSHGTLDLHNSGALVYVPEQGYVGTDSFSYEVTDGVKDSGGQESPGRATVTIQVFNTPPAGQPDAYSLPYGSRKLHVFMSSGVLANDDDADGDPIQAVLVDGGSASLGTVQLDASGGFVYTIGEQFEGSAQFTYKLTDGAQESEPIMVTITYQEGSADLVLVDDEYQVHHGSTLTSGFDSTVLDNDAIPGNYSDHTISLVETQTPGLDFNADGSFTYTAGDELGPVTFHYRVKLKDGPQQEAQVTIHVVNTLPVVSDATYDAAMGRALVVRREQGLADLARDQDGDFLTLSQAGGDGPGSLVLLPSGAFSYTPPDETFTGVAEFSYIANDGVEDSQPAKLYINVTGANTPPLASSRLYEVNVDGRLVIPRWDGLLAEATDAEADPLEAVMLDDSGLQGTLELRAGGSFMYVPPAGLSGAGDLSHEESAQFKVIDAHGQSETVNVTFRVVSKAPVATADSYEVTPGQRLVVSQRSGLLANDMDADSDLLTAELVSSPAQGVLSYFSASGAFVYVPNAGMTGSDSFTYRPTDGRRTGNEVSVTLTLGEDDPAPTASNDSYTIFRRHTQRHALGGQAMEWIGLPGSAEAKGGLLIVSAWQGVLENDEDQNNQPLTAELISGPAHGSLVAFDTTGSFIYEPSVDYVGSDSFTYRVSNGQKYSAAATVTIDVQNTAPISLADRHVLRPDSSVVTSIRNGVLANDRDEQFDVLTAVVVDQPAHGTLVFKENGAFAYTPAGGWSGTDTFTYRASDGLLQGSTQTVTLVVSAAATPEAPVGQDDQYNLAYDTTLHVPARTQGVLANDYTFNDGGLHAELVTNVSHGTLSFHTTGAFTYTPASGYVGQDSFTYTVHDSFGASSPLTVMLQVTNGSPTAVAESHRMHSLDELNISVAQGLGYRSKDADGDDLTVALASNVDPAHGSLTLNADGSYLFTPAQGFTGAASFTYTVSDGIVTSAPATVSIEVFNAAPTASNESYQLVHDGILIISANDGFMRNTADEDGDELTADVSELEGLQTWSNGAFIYHPPAGFVGQKTFTYSVSDGTTSSTPSTVTIDVTNTLPPAPSGRNLEVRHDGKLIVASDEGLIGSLKDADGDALAVVISQQPEHGSLSVNQDGSFVYTPASSLDLSSGSVADAFTWHLSDGLADSASTQASILIYYSAVTANHDLVDANGRMSYRTASDTPLIVEAKDGVLLNDLNPQQRSLTIQAGQPEHGSIDLRQNGAFVYTPEAGYVGSDSFTYTINDGISQSTASVQLEVSSSLHAQNDSYSVQHNRLLLVTPDEASKARWPNPATVVLGSVGGNDSVPEHGEPVYTLVSEPSKGTLTFASHGGFIYVPNTDYESVDEQGQLAPDSFTYKIVTQTQESNEATVTLTVGGPESPSVEHLPAQLVTSRNGVAVFRDILTNAEAGALGIDSAEAMDAVDPASPLVVQVGPLSEGIGTITAGGPGVLMFQANADQADTPANPPADPPADPVTFDYSLSRGGVTVTKKITVKVVGSAPAVHDFLPGDNEADISIHVEMNKAYTTQFTLRDLVQDADFDWRHTSGDLMINGTILPMTNYPYLSGKVALDTEGRITIAATDHIFNTVFHIKVEDSLPQQTPAVLKVRLISYYPMPLASNDVRQGDNRSTPTQVNDREEQIAQNKIIMAHVKRFKADRELTYAAADALNKRQTLTHQAHKARYDAYVTAAQTRLPEWIEKQNTLAQAILQADEARFTAESAAAELARTEEIEAELTAWEADAQAGVTYDNQLATLNAQHQQMVESSQVTMLTTISAAATAFESSSSNKRDTLLSSLKQIGITSATAQVTANATYRSSLQALEATLKSTLLAQNQARDQAMNTAQATLTTQKNQARSTLESTISSAMSAYESAVEDALDDRDVALSQSLSTRTAAIAAAQSLYDSGTQDQNITNPLDLGNQSAYLTAVAAAMSNYDTSVNQVRDAFDAAVSTASQSLRTALADARAASSATLAAADATYRSSVLAAEAGYEQAVDSALVNYDNAVIQARQGLKDSLVSAQFAYVASVSQADATFDSQMQSAISTHHQALRTATVTYDDAIVAGMEDHEGALQDLDEAYRTAITTNRNAYQVAQLDAYAAYRQSQADATAAWTTSRTDAQQTLQDALFTAASNLAQDQSDASTTLNTTLLTKEKDKFNRAFAAEAEYRDDTIDELNILRDNANNDFYIYASQVQTLTQTLANQMLLALLPSSISFADLVTVNPDEAVPVKEAANKLTVAKIALEVSEAAHALASNNVLVAARATEATALKNSTMQYEREVSNAVISHVRALVTAETDFAHDQATARLTMITTQADAELTWANAIATAASTWRKALGDAQKTYLQANAQAIETYAQGQAAANADYASSQSQAGESLSSTVADIHVDLNQATTNIMSAWRSSHDSALSDFTTSRAAVMSAFANNLQSAETNLDNAVIAAATNLFVQISAAAQQLAIDHAQGLQTYSDSANDAFDDYIQAILPELQDYLEDERLALTTLITAVQNQRVSTIDTWRTAEATHWATFIHSAALAEKDYVLASNTAQTTAIQTSEAASKVGHIAFGQAQSTQAGTLVVAISDFASATAIAGATYEQGSQTALQTMTSDHNALRNTYLTAMADLTTAEESSTADALSAYNQDISGSQATFQNATAQASAVLGISIAQADGDLLEESSDSLQTLRESQAAAVKTRDTELADITKTLSVSEADAGQTHTSSLLTAWKTQHVETAGLHTTFAKSIDTANGDYRKVWNVGHQLVEVMKVNFDPDDTPPSGQGSGSTGAFRQAIGDLHTLYAQADGEISTAKLQARSTRWTHWQSQTTYSRLQSIPVTHYHAFVVLQQQMDRALEVAEIVTEGLIELIPIVGNGYTAYKAYKEGDWRGVATSAAWLALEVVPIAKLAQITGKLAKFGLAAGAKLFSKSRKGFGLARNLLAGTAGKMRSLASGIRSSRLTSPAMACATCLVAGTAVQTVDGAVLIENIRPGDQVLAYDSEAGEWTYDRVTARHERMRETQVVTITVELADGSTDSLTATSDHPFWVESGQGLATRSLATAHAGQRDGRHVSTAGGRWIEAGHLTLGDQLLTSQSESATIIGLQVRTERQRVYNLTVLRLHNYAAGTAGVLVHNSGACGVKSLVNGLTAAQKKAVKQATLKLNQANGKLAELQVVESLKAAGIDVVGTNIYMKTKLGRREIDIVYRVGDKYYGIEVKSGNAVRSASQVLKDNLINLGQAKFVGKKAMDANLWNVVLEETRVKYWLLK